MKPAFALVIVIASFAACKSGDNHPEPDPSQFDFRNMRVWQNTPIVADLSTSTAGVPDHDTIYCIQENGQSFIERKGERLAVKTFSDYQTNDTVFSGQSVFLLTAAGDTVDFCPGIAIAKGVTPRTSIILVGRNYPEGFISVSPKLDVWPKGITRRSQYYTR